VLKRGVHLCDVEVAESDGHCNFNQGSHATMLGVTVIDVVVGVAGVEVAIHEAAGTGKHHGVVCAMVHW
jgi:hypothetical protein